MARTLITGIDIGSHYIKIVVAEKTQEKDMPLKVIASVQTPTRGLRFGYVAHPLEAIASLREAIAQAEKISKVKIRRAFIGVNGIGLSSSYGHASVIVSKADQMVSEHDIENLHSQAEKDMPASQSANRKIIHVIPQYYKIDGKVVLGQPLGIKGSKLEAKLLFITCIEHHVNDIIQIIQDSGIDIEDVMAAPIAASLVTLSKQQKIAGCVLANIGAETVSIVVYENGIPVSLEVFPLGSSDITNDIALGLRVPLEDAENIKLGTINSQSFPKKKLDDIIEARLSDICELIDNHLKKLGRSGLLPAGIIMTGGGSGIGMAPEYAKNALRLPSRISQVTFSQSKHTLIENTYAVAAGLCLFGIQAEFGPGIAPHMQAARQVSKKLMSWIKQFMP